MILTADRRYRNTAENRATIGRHAGFALDLLTGGQVFIKTGPPVQLLHEYSVLLQLPPGISARALDLVAIDAQRLGLVQERLDGHTWFEAEPTRWREGLPHLVLDLCDRLAGLHRLGFSHTDLKPANLFLLAEPAGETRLLDLGSARSVALLNLPENADDATAVTAPFAAPELLRGWAADARADQFSLGKVLQWMAARTAVNPAWAGIIERLTQPLPSRRFADLVEVQEEICRCFDVAMPPSRCPALGAGPLRGREHELAEVVRWARTPDSAPLLLVHAQPGTGLTRFLLESLAAVIGADAPPIRTVEFPRAGSGDGLSPAAAVDLLEGYAGDGKRVVLGLPDPGPSLSWLSGTEADRLRRLLDRGGATRLFLRPVRPAALQDIVASCLGAGGSATDALGLALHAKAEGDLPATAEGLGHVFARSASRDGVRWILDGPRAAAATEGWPTPRLFPSVADVPESLREPLRILARAGLVVPADVARDLLCQFGHPDTLGPLRELGVVYDLPGGRIRFLHRSLREEARSQAPLAGESVDRWLCAHADPDPRDAVQAREAAARAHRLADPARERACLVPPLQLAALERRWSDVRLLLEYPSGIWTEENARQRAADLHRTLGEEWPAEYLLYLMGECLLALGDPLGSALLALVAQAPRTAGGYRGLALLASSHAQAGRLDDLSRLLQQMEEAAAGGAEPVSGLVALQRANWHVIQGRRKDAHEQVGMAARQLQGSGLPQESEIYLSAAAVCMPDHPDEAIDWLHRGLAEIRIPYLRSAMHRLLAGVHEFCGNPVEFAHHAQAALDDLADGDYPRHRIFLRTQRAWAWAHSDRAGEAREDATDLLQSPILQRDPPRMVFTTMLAGYAALQQGNGRAAIAQFATAWEALGPSHPAGRRASVLRSFLDALLDLRAWAVVREHAESLSLPSGSPEMAATLTRARALALQAQAGGSDIEAHAILAELTTEARGHSGALDSARFLHHQAEAALAFDPEAAARLFPEALDRFGLAGFGYYRARSMLGLARAQIGIKPSLAHRTVEEAIQLARRIDARGVLAEALRLRAEWELSGRC